MPTDAHDGYSDGPCDHLTWEALSCWNRQTDPRTGKPVAWHGIPPGGLVALYPMEWREGRGTVLGSIFTLVRDACDMAVGHNCPVTVGSAYRPYAYDLDAGGVSGTHVMGLAMDLWTPAELTRQQFHQIVLALATAHKVIGGVGLYDWGCHTDGRKRLADGSFTRWTG